MVDLQRHLAVRNLMVRSAYRGGKISVIIFGRDGSYQFLRAAGAPVRRRGAAGAPAARKN